MVKIEVSMRTSFARRLADGDDDAGWQALCSEKGLGEVRLPTLDSLRGLCR